MFTLKEIRQLPLILLVGYLLAATPCLARDSEIQGTVADTSGGVIPGAEVTVTNLDTGVVRSAIANGVGFYSVPLLKEGLYQVTCGNVGFDTVQTKIGLGLGQVVRHDFQLQVGQASFRVEVKAASSRIEQQAHSAGTVIEEKQIHELPLDGRNYLSLAGLSPGILRGGQGGRGEQTSPEGGYRSGGLPFDQTAILVDGVDNAARTVQGPLITQAQTLKPSVDAISEFKVVTHNVSAEYGYKAGAQVIVSTKGGTNRFHGSLYHFHRNRAFSANHFMFNRDAPPPNPITGEATPPPPYIRNQFGGTLGGPIFADKTFFFVSFQGTRLREGGASFLQSVPSPMARQGNFSQEVGGANRGRLIYDPLTRGPGGERQPFEGSIIPQNRMDPVAMRVLELYPLPNVPGEEFSRLNYFVVQRFRNDNEVYDVRVDHNFNDSHRMFGRYSHRSEDRIGGPPLPFPARTSSILQFTGHQVALNYNATFGARMHNEFRFGYTHFPSARVDEHTENLNAVFGVKNAAIDQFPDFGSDEFKKGLVFFGVGGYSGVGGGAGGGTNTTVLDTLYIADNFQIMVGKHSLKFGGEFRSWRSDRTQGTPFGQMNFHGSGKFTARFSNPASANRTGHPLADAMLGWTNATFNVPLGDG